jgi:hypothetical protein
MLSLPLRLFIVRHPDAIFKSQLSESLFKGGAPEQPESPNAYLVQANETGLSSPTTMNKGHT